MNNAAVTATATAITTDCGDFTVYNDGAGNWTVTYKPDGEVCILSEWSNQFVDTFIGAISIAKNSDNWSAPVIQPTVEREWVYEQEWAGWYWENTAKGIAYSRSHLIIDGVPACGAVKRIQSEWSNEQDLDKGRCGHCLRKA